MKIRPSGKNGNGMKVLIIGNEGYIGPHIIAQIKKNTLKSYVAGFDIGYFAHTITSNAFPERYENSLSHIQLQTTS